MNKVEPEKYFYKIHLTAVPSAGANISDCVNQALLLSLSENKTVEVTFNGTKIEIDPVAIRAMFIQKWEDDRAKAQRQ